MKIDKYGEKVIGIVARNAVGQQSPGLADYDVQPHLNRPDTDAPKLHGTFGVVFVDQRNGPDEDRRLSIVGIFAVGAGNYGRTGTHGQRNGDGDIAKFQLGGIELVLNVHVRRTIAVHRGPAID